MVLDNGAGSGEMDSRGMGGGLRVHAAEGRRMGKPQG